MSKHLRIRGRLILSLYWRWQNVCEPLSGIDCGKLTVDYWHHSGFLTVSWGFLGPTLSAGRLHRWHTGRHYGRRVGLREYGVTLRSGKLPSL